MVSWKRTNIGSCLVIILILIIFASLLLAFLIYNNVGIIYPHPIVNVYKVGDLNDTFSFDLRCDKLYDISFLDTLMFKCNVFEYISTPTSHSLCIINPYLRGIMKCDRGYIASQYREKQNDLSFNRAMFIFCICLIVAGIMLILSVGMTLKICCCNKRSEIMEDDDLIKKKNSNNNKYNQII